MKRFRFIFPTLAAAIVLVASALVCAVRTVRSWIYDGVAACVRAFKVEPVRLALNAATGLVTAGAYRANTMRREQPLHAPGGWRMCPSG
jgi:hypothetical protein